LDAMSLAATIESRKPRMAMTVDVPKHFVMYCV